MPRATWEEPQTKTGEEYSVIIFDEGETIKEHAQSEDFTPPNPNMVSLVTDSHNKELASDRQTFQVGDDIYEEESASLPEPHIQLTPHQIKWLQMKDPSL